MNRNSTGLSADNKNLLYKKLYRDDDTGKLILTDSNNHKYETDIFGRKITLFLPHISGVKSGYERAQLKYNSTSPSYENGIIHLKKSMNYLPTVNRFDGYNYYRAPISAPFTNTPQHEINQKTKMKILSQIKKYYKDENTKLKTDNKPKFGLSYLTKDLNEYDIREEDLKNILKLIDENMEEIKQKYKIKLNVMHKDPIYISLNQFKKRILSFKKNEVKFDAPPESIKKKYEIFKNILKINIKKKRLNSMDQNAYIEKYLMKKKNLSFNENDISKNYFHEGPDRLNIMLKSNDFALGNSIKMEFGGGASKEEKKHENLSGEEGCDISTLPKISRNSLTKNNTKLSIDTAETLPHNNKSNCELKIIDEKNEDELSFLSLKSVKKNNNIKKPKIKFLQNIESNCEKEKKLLEGHFETPKEEIQISKPSHNIKNTIKNNGELYLRDMELLKLTNPIKYELIQKKNDYDLKMLMKKLGRRPKTKIQIKVDD